MRVCCPALTRKLEPWNEVSATSQFRSTFGYVRSIGSSSHTIGNQNDSRNNDRWRRTCTPSRFRTRNPLIRSAPLSGNELSPVHGYGRGMSLSSSSASITRLPRGMTAFAIFLLFGAGLASLAGTTLLWRGTVLDGMWAVNPRAYNHTEKQSGFHFCCSESCWLFLELVGLNVAYGDRDWLS